MADSPIRRQAEALVNLEIPHTLAAFPYGHSVFSYNRKPLIEYLNRREQAGVCVPIRPCSG